MTETPSGGPTASAAPGQPPKTSGLAIASLACGLLSPCTIGISGIVGVVLGLMAFSRISRGGGTVGGRRMAVAGTVLSAVGSLILPLALVVGVIVYRQDVQEQHIQAATAARMHADAIFDSRDFYIAAGEYLGIVSDYPEMPDLGAYARCRYSQAHAEKALQEKQWDVADEWAQRAEKQGAPPAWVADFKGRFQREHDMAKKMSPARALIVKGTEAYSNDRLDEAADFFVKARQQAESLQDADLLMETRKLQAAVDKRQRLIKAWTAAEKAFAEGNYAEAAKYYKMCHDVSPSDVFQAKYNKAMALDFLNQARVFKENGLPKEAATLYSKVLEYDPENAEAKKFLENVPRSGGP